MILFEHILQDFIDSSEISEKTWYHTTTAERAENIEENGFDLWAGDDGCIWLSLEPFRALSYDDNDDPLNKEVIFEVELNSKPFFVVSLEKSDTVPTFIKEKFQNTQAVYLTLPKFLVVFDLSIINNIRRIA